MLRVTSVGVALFMSAGHLSAEPETSKELQAAVVQLAIASSCAKELGQDHIFSYYADRFRGIAKKELDGPDLEEVDKAILAMQTEAIKISPDDEPNMFTVGFCKMLADEMP